MSLSNIFLLFFYKKVGLNDVFSVETQIIKEKGVFVIKWPLS